VISEGIQFEIEKKEKKLAEFELEQNHVVR
jgi:hypothetical protein